MKKLTTMLSALALMTFGAWAQDAAPVAEEAPAAVVEVVDAPAVEEVAVEEVTPAVATCGKS